jgi:acetyl-CoA carboxylase carboxyl transferase alpha subunit
MTAYDKLKTARAADRPTAAAYIGKLFTQTVELHGDRAYSDDAAIIGGIGFLGDTAVTYIGMEKGSDIQERMRRNFGCPKPEGYRKALRLMKHAEKFRRPIICFVDTLGAYCGADAEERGQCEAIARNLTEMMGLRTPVISLIIGEGGSGGALALATADRVYMLENAVYSVITPEGCASILWKDASKAQRAADFLHITAQDMKEFGVAETVIAENFADFPHMCETIRLQLQNDLRALCALPADQLPDRRYARFRKFGIFEETPGA